MRVEKQRMMYVRMSQCYATTRPLPESSDQESVGDDDDDVGKPEWRFVTRY